MWSTAVSLPQAHLLGLRHDVIFGPVGSRGGFAVESECAKSRSGDASQCIGVSFDHQGRSVLAQGSRRSPKDLKLKPFNVNFDQRRRPELMAEMVDRCGSHGSVGDSRRGFRELGDGGLAHDRDVTEAIECGLSFGFGGVRWIRLDRDDQPLQSRRRERPRGCENRCATQRQRTCPRVRDLRQLTAGPPVRTSRANTRPRRFVWNAAIASPWRGPGGPQSRCHHDGA